MVCEEFKKTGLETVKRIWVSNKRKILLKMTDYSLVIHKSSLMLQKNITKHIQMLFILFLYIDSGKFLYIVLGK